MRFFGYLLFSFLLYGFFIGTTYLSKGAMDWFSVVLAFPLSIGLCFGVVRLPLFREYYRTNSQVIGSTLGSYHSRAEIRVAPVMVTFVVSVAVWLVLYAIFQRHTGIIAFCGGIAGGAFSWYFEDR